MIARRESWSVLALALAAACGSPLDRAERAPRPLPRILRVDMLHRLAPDGAERFEVQGVRDEGQWAAGSWMIDDSDLGVYRASLIDVETGQIVFSRGFCSVFAEWLTTDDSRRDRTRAFQESVRVPQPARAARLRIERRDARQRFVTVHEDALPEPRSGPHSAPPPAPDVVDLSPIGEVARRVDLLFIAEGYALAERDDFLADARRLADVLFACEPFRSRRDDFNVRAAFVASASSGISDMRAGDRKDTAIGAAFGTFGLDRYVLAEDDRRWRDVAAGAPYDAAIVLLNTSRYGGGGIYQLYCMAAADADLAGYLVLHEFGHSFAALGDEYYASPVAYEGYARKDVEPWEPNVTALLDPESLKWRHLVPPGTALPTPWEKEALDGQNRALEAHRAALEAQGLSAADQRAGVEAERRRLLERIFRPEQPVGAYEGALYESRGLYRPEVDCIMFRKDARTYCRVCAEAIEAAIDRLTGASTVSDWSGP